MNSRSLSTTEAYSWPGKARGQNPTHRRLFPYALSARLIPMRERDDRPGGDVRGPTSGDYSVDNFPDWDNPEDADDEDEWEDAPEGYYDDEVDDEGGYIPGPGDPDYDLSEAAGYAGYEPPKHRGLVPQWVIVVFSIVLILSFILPLLLRP